MTGTSTSPAGRGAGSTDWRAVADGVPASALLSGTTILWTSTAAADLVDATPADLVGTDVLDLVVPADRERTVRALQDAQDNPGTSRGPFVVRLLARPAQWLEIALRARSGDDSEDRSDDHVVVVGWDVSARVETERELGHRASHDSLTGLPNRALLADRWTRARSRTAHAPGLRTFLLLCDVDGLKQVNDREGHRAGDELIVEVAHLLTSEVRPSDTVARLGGDEFVVLVEDVPAGHIEALAQRLRRTVSPAGEGAAAARMSVGWTQDDPARAPEVVLAEADARMYEDKRSGRDAGPRSVDVRRTDVHRADVREVDVRDGERLQTTTGGQEPPST